MSPNPCAPHKPWSDLHELDKHPQTLSELERLRRQVRQPFTDKSSVAAAIGTLEAGLRARTQVGRWLVGALVRGVCVGGV
jgi:hypothetical protein